MKLLQLTDSIMDQSLTEATFELSSNRYIAHAQIQPLTDLMVEIIIFQLRERALFADVEISAYNLN
jgi:hypothetical protein